MYATMATFRRKTEQNKMKDASINRIAGLPTDIWPIIAAILAMSGQSDIMWNYRLNSEIPGVKFVRFLGRAVSAYDPGHDNLPDSFFSFSSSDRRPSKPV